MSRWRTVKALIGIRGPTGMLCPKCKKDMVKLRHLMMGVDWECRNCEKKYASPNSLTDELIDLSKVAFDGVIGWRH